uniref:Uncharacterized protein n=1 Tax=Siphoviridae sp. ctMBu2 TaxID=2827853 RepID=A0A8S5T4U6_9CAUD|nr:MAG TPA: hypothetical protein [Siphoviridae sp. ctMBu2]DAX93808.1 MAG TPA: hypothetical protein [Caudoviricetes sp.]
MTPPPGGFFRHKAKPRRAATLRGFFIQTLDGRLKR